MRMGTFVLKMLIVMGSVILIQTGAPQKAWAYHEEIGAGSKEVFIAALQALKPYGINQQDEEKLYIETDWVLGSSERTTSLYFTKIQKTLQRRTKFKVSFKAWPRYTEVDIRAEDQFKRASSSEKAPWRKMKPAFDDYSQERELFRKILSQIEFNRRPAK